MSRHTATPKSVHLLHLDLGIGGAERLMVNVALSLLKLDFEVTIVTTHHDLQHCFDECKASGALHGKIRVYGNWLPRQILGRGTALCSHIRILYASLCLLGLHCYAILCGRGSGSDRVAAMVVDGISSPLPLFLWASIPTVFYCHYPDLLLCTSRTDPLTSLYRLVLDTIEEVTTGCADVLLVNSLFTKDVFRQAFPQLWRLVQPDVLYPCLEEYAESTDSEPPAYLALGTAGWHVPPSLSLFVSLNRFERKKKVELALEALALVKSKKLAPSCKGDMPKALLVIAGGYDPRVLENIEYLEELKTRANELGLVWSMPAAATVDAEEASGPISSCDVVFRLSIAAHERNALLQYASALLYTPDKEHFGIVPIEAMRAGCPVIAVNSGGPVETILHQETGYLCEQSAASFANAMELLMKNVPKRCAAGPESAMYIARSPLSLSVGAKGKLHALAHFSSGTMVESLRDCMEKLGAHEAQHQKVYGRKCLVAIGTLVALCLAILIHWMLQ